MTTEQRMKILADYYEQEFTASAIEGFSTPPLTPHEDVLRLIAERFPNADERELQGVMVRVIARADLVEKDITPAFASESLDAMERAMLNPISPSRTVDPWVN